jgi:enoyl-CoA hydratase/carnithine racemase
MASTTVASSPTVTLEVNRHVGELTLRRPERRNALDDATLTELMRLLEIVEDDRDIRVVVLRGEGKSFCAGYDLNHDDGPIVGVDGWRRQFHFENRVFWKLWDLRVPTIAAVHGHAIGLGCDLAATSMVTLAEQSAKFSMPEVRFEMAPSFLVLPWLGSPKKMTEFLLTGDSVMGDAAVELGIATRIVDDGTVAEEAMALARRLVKIPPEGLAIAKAQWRAVLESQGLRQGMSHIVELAALCGVHESEESRQFNEVMARDGLRAAIAWRDQHFEEKE